jgi:hypothetical protein
MEGNSEFHARTRPGAIDAVRHHAKYLYLITIFHGRAQGAAAQQNRLAGKYLIK